jgi:hypothetical protein
VATLETPAEPIKPTDPVIQRGRGRPRKHPVIKNPVTNHLTPVNISTTISIDILIII